MYCTKCGTKLLENAKFCHVCGTEAYNQRKFTKEHSVQETTVPKKTQRRWLRIIGFIILVLAAAVTAFLCWLFGVGEPTIEDILERYPKEIVGTADDEFLTCLEYLHEDWYDSYYGEFVLLEMDALSIFEDAIFEDPHLKEIYDSYMKILNEEAEGLVVEESRYYDFKDMHEYYRLEIKKFPLLVELVSNYDLMDGSEELLRYYESKPDCFAALIEIDTDLEEQICEQTLIWSDLEQCYIVRYSNRTPYNFALYAYYEYTVDGDDVVRGLEYTDIAPDDEICLKLTECPKNYDSLEFNLYPESIYLGDRYISEFQYKD